MIKKILYLVLILLILVALVYFSIQNNEQTSVHLLQYRIDLTVGYLVIVMTIIGMILAGIFLLPYALIQRMQIISLRSKCKKLTKRLDKEHDQVEVQSAIIEEQSANIDELKGEVNEKEKTGLIQGALLSSLNLTGAGKNTNDEVTDEENEKAGE